MLWRRLPLDGVGSCRLFFTDDLHDNLSWVPASDKPHTFKSCFTHSSQVFFGRPGPFLPGTGLDLTLFISPLERMTCPNHLSRRSRTRMARSHIPSLACSSSIDGSSDGLTPQIQRIIARSLRHSRWRAAEVMGQVSVPCNIELRTLELNLWLNNKRRLWCEYFGRNWLCYKTPLNKTLIGILPIGWELHKNANIFFWENIFENVICKVWAILFRPQCIKRKLTYLSLVKKHCAMRCIDSICDHFNMCSRPITRTLCCRPEDRKSTTVRSCNEALIHWGRDKMDVITQLTFQWKCVNFI